MDVNIITFHRDYNYGAMLQAYALQEFLGQIGHPAGVFDYIRPKNASGSLKQQLLDFVCRLNKKDCEIRETKYREFYKSFLKLNNDCTKSVYVTGSDQVWNPHGVMDEHYFLTFVPQTSKKISYAASLGVSEIPEERKATFKRYIQDFDAVSVREESAKECISELYDREISVNVDPTLLHDKNFWRTIAEPVENMPEKYILVYLMHLPKNINKILTWLKKETGYDIVVVDGQGAVQGVLTNAVKHNKAVHRAGPQQFVWLMDHAQCVVTSSFHGTAFSLIFEKEFYAITNSPKSRLANILNKCSLPFFEETEADFVRNDNIDWLKVSAVLKNEREKAKQYFQGVL